MSGYSGKSVCPGWAFPCASRSRPSPGRTAIRRPGLAESGQLGGANIPEKPAIVAEPGRFRIVQFSLGIQERKFLTDWQTVFERAEKILFVRSPALGRRRRPWRSEDCRLRGGRLCGNLLGGRPSFAIFGDFSDVLAIVFAPVLRCVARRPTWRHSATRTCTQWHSASASPKSPMWKTRWRCPVSIASSSARMRAAGRGPLSSRSQIRL